MLIMRPGQRLYIPGVQVMTPRPVAAASNWWDVAGQTCIAAYAPKGAADLASSYINLANPGTYNASPGVAPTHSSVDGWTFNGSTQYLTTGIVPASGWSMIIRFSGITGLNGNAIGSRSALAVDRFFLSPVFGGTQIRYGYSTGAVSTSPNMSNGLMAIAGTICYRNGTSDGTVSGTLTAPAAIIIGGINTSGVADTFLAGKIQHLAIYSTTLSAGDVASLTTRMNLI